MTKNAVRLQTELYMRCRYVVASQTLQERNSYTLLNRNSSKKSGLAKKKSDKAAGKKSGLIRLILLGSINEYRQHAGGKGVRITSVGWQVTLCDSI